jgi:hypothetical protein
VAGDQWQVKRRWEEDNAEAERTQRERREGENKTPGAKPAPGAPDEEMRKRAAHPWSETLRVKRGPFF